MTNENNPPSAPVAGLALPLQKRAHLPDQGYGNLFYIVQNSMTYGVRDVIASRLGEAVADALVTAANRAPVYDELLSALRFADNEVNVARGVLWAKADVVEHQPDGERHARQLRRSAEKLDEVSRRCREAIDAALSHAEQVQP